MFNIKHIYRVEHVSFPARSGKTTCPTLGERRGRPARLLAILSRLFLAIAAGVYLSDAPSYMTPSPPPLTHCIRVHRHTGKGGGEGWRDEPERRLEGQQFTKLGQKYVPT
jgi:hypothetical protein